MQITEFLQYSHIGGELSSYKAQLKTLESDAQDFKNIHKKYRDQLIKVKVSYSGHPFLTSDVAFYKFHRRCLTWRTTTWKSMPKHWTSELPSQCPMTSAHARSSAIMKYHSLKMEEVNDTMRHLWNKTYQGTGVYARKFLGIFH